MTYKFHTLTAAVLIAGTLSLEGAQANIMTGNNASARITKAEDPNIQTVAKRKWLRQGGGQRYMNSRNSRRIGDQRYVNSRRIGGQRFVNGGRRYYNGGNYYRNYHDNDDWDNGVWLGLGIGLLPFLGSYYGGYGGYNYGDYGGYPYYGGSGHVSWCINHYRSYDVSSDTYLGYDGRRHYCRSPYRY